MRKLFFLSVTIMSVFIGCTDTLDEKTLNKRYSPRTGDETEAPAEDNVEDSQTWLLEYAPIASAGELQEYESAGSYGQIEVLNYRFARNYGFAEFVANIELYYPPQVRTALGRECVLDIQRLSFADRPVIVYDYENKPYYYEFPLLYDGNAIVGTVTVAAQPQTDEIVAYVFPASINYSQYSYTHQRYIGNYPVVYYGNGQGMYQETFSMEGTQIVSTLVDVTDDCITSVYERAQAMLNTIPEADKDSMLEDIIGEPLLLDSTFIIGSLEDWLEDFRRPDTLIGFWHDKEGEGGEIDAEFELNDQILQWIDENSSAVYEDDPSHVGFLSEYSDHRLRLTHWGDFCGPSILSWTYRGKYDSYDEKYLPIFGDNIDNTSLYPYLCISDTNAVYSFAPYTNESNTYQTRSDRSNSTDNGLYYTFFQETIKTGEKFPLYLGGMKRGVHNATNGAYTIKMKCHPITWLEEEQEPVIVASINGAAHYWCAIGYAYRRGSLGRKKNMRIFVTDNGVYSKDHHYYPYWSKLGASYYAWVPN